MTKSTNASEKLLNNSSQKQKKLNDGTVVKSGRPTRNRPAIILDYDDDKDLDGLDIDNSESEEIPQEVIKEKKQKKASPKNKKKKN